MGSSRGAPYLDGNLTSVSAADFAFLIAESNSIDWGLTVGLIVGGAISFLVIWGLTRQTRRAAHEQAAELIEVARREAAVAAEELKQKTDAEIQEKRAEMNRDFDRREIETDVRLVDEVVEEEHALAAAVCAHLESRPVR